MQKPGEAPLESNPEVKGATGTSAVFWSLQQKPALAMGILGQEAIAD